MNLVMEKGSHIKNPLAEFPAMHRVYDILYWADQIWILGEDDSIHQAKVCLYDKQKKKITITYLVGNIPSGRIFFYEKNALVCTEENGLLIVDLRPDQNMKAFTFMYNMKPQFGIGTSDHIYILRKLELGFNITALKIKINSQNDKCLENDYSIPLAMSRPYDLQYFYDNDAKCHSFLVI